MIVSKGVWMAIIKRLSEEQRQGIEAVAMDIWDPYIASTRGYVPEAERRLSLIVTI
jgi:hypothetical protein